MSEKIKLTKEQVLSCVPDYVELYYVDYRDSLSEHPEFMQRLLREEDAESEVYEWWDSSDTFHYIKQKIEQELVSKFELDADELEEVMEEFWEELENEIYEKDKSDPLAGLIRNTGEVVMFYDTGLYIEYPDSKAERRLQRMQIKKLLKITGSHYDDDIDELLANIFYGGELRIYFTSELTEFLYHNNQEYKSIDFNGLHLAIVNSSNGSGYHVYLDGLSVILPFKVENLFIDEAVHYDYTNEIAGMFSDWCSGTSAIGLTTLSDGEVCESGLNVHIDRLKEYEETYRNDGCTFGDMDIRRHRDVYYRNDYPAGNKCPHCGTFWVD